MIFIRTPAHPPSLPPPRPAICIFYLVLRALDTVEDDMTIPPTKKVTLLKEFHTHLHQPGWRYTESREKDRVVLEEFPAVSDLASLCAIEQQKIDVKVLMTFLRRKIIALFMDLHTASHGMLWERG